MDHVLGWFQRRATDQPAARAIVGPSGLVAYGDLARRAGTIARSLLDAGLAAGDRVLLEDAQGPEWVASLFGVVGAGGQAVIPDPSWSPAEVAQITGPLSPGWRTGSEDIVRLTGTITGDRALTAGRAGIWLFTSGTTARPQARFRSSAALADMIRRVMARLPPTIADSRPASLCMLPTYHGFGLLNAVVLVLSIGGEVNLADGEEPATACRLIEERGIRVVYAWPSHFTALVERGSWSGGTNPLRWCVSSSSPLDPAVAARFAQQTGCPVRLQYGTTETGPLSLDGVPFDGIEIRVDGADGRAVPPGVEGRIGVRMLDETSDLDLAVDDDGWFRPGDLGRIDSNGRLVLTGRYRPLFDERAALMDLR
jgi:acyl-CoA synthetase (AMP-forming)/AMP-acid ligase II